MKKIRLDALRMEIPVRDDVFYFDLGHKSDMDDTSRFLCHKHGTVYRPDDAEYLGAMFDMEDDTGHYVYIFYKHLDNGWAEIRVRGGMETHVLQATGNVLELQRRLVDRQFEIDLSKYDPKIAAAIGGWYAILAWGQPLDHYDPTNEEDGAAFHILKESAAKCAVKADLKTPAERPN